MIQFIFPLDSIDEGRKKIDYTFFSGYTPNGYWKSLNSGSTGFSLEFTASTAGISNNNTDTSINSNNMLVGNNNKIVGSGGYNFLKGKNNLIKDSNFSYIDGELINVSAITSSFIFGRNLKISGANNSAFINMVDSEIYPNFKTNYATLFGIYKNKFSNENLLSENNFLLQLNSKESYITGITNYYTNLNGSFIKISGDVKHCVVAGNLNSIGYDYPNPSSGSHENIFIFGSNIKPSLSAMSITSLSGTYVNSIFVKNNLFFNKKIPDYSLITSAKTEFTKKNLYEISGLMGSKITAVSQDFDSLYYAPNSGTGFFFIIYFDESNSGGSLSGSSNNFIDDYGYDNKIEISTNLYSANTAFFGYSDNLKKYIKYKG